MRHGFKNLESLEVTSGALALVAGVRISFVERLAGALRIWNSTLLNISELSL